MDRHDVDVMAGNETWSRDGGEGRAPSVRPWLPVTPYSLTDRSVRSRGGGVGFFIRRGITIRTFPSNGPGR